MCELFTCALAFKRMIAHNSMWNRAFLLVQGTIQYLVHPKGKFWSFFFNKSFRMSSWHLIKPLGLPRTLYWASVIDIPPKNPIKTNTIPTRSLDIMFDPPNGQVLVKKIEKKTMEWYLHLVEWIRRLRIDFGTNWKNNILGARPSTPNFSGILPCVWCTTEWHHTNTKRKFCLLVCMTQSHTMSDFHPFLLMANETMLGRACQEQPHLVTRNNHFRFTFNQTKLTCVFTH